MYLKRLLPLAAVYYKSILVAIALVTAAAVYPLDDLTVNVSGESLMVTDAQTRGFYQQTLETFGSDELILLVVQDEHLFDPDKLASLRDTLSRIESLPFVDHIDSLFSIQHIRNVDGVVSWGPYIGSVPETREQGVEIQQAALKNPLIKGNLLSEDGKSMVVAIQLRDRGEEAFSDETVVAGIEHAIEPLVRDVDNAFQIGQATIRETITNNILKDQLMLLPLSLIVLLVALIIALKRPLHALMPLITAGLSIVWTLGFMATLDIPLNVMTSIVPALLIIVGSTEDVHLLTAYQTGIQEGHYRKDAVQFMSSTTSMAVVLTFITSYLGFLSIVSNDIEILQQFGLVASSGLFFNFLITSLMVPIYVRFFGEVKSRDDIKKNVFARLIVGVFPFIQKRKRLVAGLSLAILVVSGIGALNLRVNNNFMDYFPEDASVRVRADTLQTQLSGMYRFDIVLEGHIEGTFLKVRYLEEIEKLQEYLNQGGLFGKSMSFADYLGLVHHVMDEIEGDDFYLPDADEIVQEYMHFVKHEYVRPYVSPDFSAARIIVLHSIDDSQSLSKALKGVRGFIHANLDPNLDVRVTGESVLTNEAADNIVVGQGKSLLLMLFIILLIVTTLFTNLTAGIIAIVPNLIPIIVLFGVMGFWSIPLDTGTAMVAAIAIGIAVDDTIHFMTRYNQQMHLSSGRSQALRQTMEEEARPIMATSIALSLGFATLGLSDFPPVRHFGLLSALVIMLALFANFVTTPLLLSYVRLVTVWDLLAVRLKSHIVNRCPLFKDMSMWEVRKIVLVSQPIRYRAGSTIFAQGESGKEMFVILDGEVEMEHREENGEICVIDKLHAGQVFGAAALAADVPRPVTVVANKDSELLALKWSSLRRIGHLFPYLSSKLYRNVSGIIGKRLAGELEAINQREEHCGKSAHALEETELSDEESFIKI